MKGREKRNASQLPGQSLFESANADFSTAQGKFMMKLASNIPNKGHICACLFPCKNSLTEYWNRMLVADIDTTRPSPAHSVQTTPGNPIDLD